MVEVPVKLYIQGLAQKAKMAARPLAKLSSQKRTCALEAMLIAFQESKSCFLEANRLDLEAISKEIDKQIYRQAVDRIRVSEDDFTRMEEWFQRVVESVDPIGEVSRLWLTDDGMQVGRMRVPLGVVAVISDMAPHVAVEAFAMCIKTGNVCIYRGGSEWFHTNKAIADCLSTAGTKAGLPEGAMTFVDRPQPEAALELIRLVKYVDAVIPRGNTSMRKGIMGQAKIPVLGYDGGISHVYVDGEVDIPLAQTIVVNAKVQDPEASNSVDTVLIHQKVARHILPGLMRRLLEEFKVTLTGCPKTVSMMGIMEMTGHLGIKDAVENDWGEKYQSMAMNIKIVTDLEEALGHIEKFSPGHTDTIVTRNYQTAMRFVQEVDSSAVMVNASTRLHGGEQMGLGPELGMSTTPFHARGPLTLDALTTEKFVALGTGQLQQPHPVPQAYLDAMMLSSKF
ncbi:MAG: glutamate-5-semialdehyde dehydrogenase [Nitrospirales bacterium]|nr:glutamate-5-semialdehyde dehydrogenase [Nitrospira sp.]MDR4502861.1 glutamate-5-semialdehyde dehydrogenase [Nitrospirales bacterium]